MEADSSLQGPRECAGCAVELLTCALADDFFPVGYFLRAGVGLLRTVIRKIMLSAYPSNPIPRNGNAIQVSTVDSVVMPISEKRIPTPVKVSPTITQTRYRRDPFSQGLLSICQGYRPRTAVQLHQPSAGHTGCCAAVRSCASAGEPRLAPRLSAPGVCPRLFPRSASS